MSFFFTSKDFFPESLHSYMFLQDDAFKLLLLLLLLLLSLLLLLLLLISDIVDHLQQFWTHIYDTP